MRALSVALRPSSALLAGTVTQCRLAFKPSSITTSLRSQQRALAQDTHTTTRLTAVAALSGAGATASSRSFARSVRAMASASNGASGSERAVLGGGCFWCIEACLRQMKGVSSVLSGYAAGHVSNPTYEEVCAKRTGHAEVVAVDFDPSVISYKEILEVFFTLHDPTTKDRQGNDVGPQYRSIILYTSPEQKAVAEEVMARVQAEQWWGSAPLVTELEQLQTDGPAKYWEGESYHQDYFAQNPGNGYCRVVVAPKVAKFRSKFLSKLIPA